MAEVGRSRESIKRSTLKHYQLQKMGGCPSSRGSLRGFIFTCNHHQAGGRSQGIGCSGSLWKLRDHRRPETPPLPEPYKRSALASGFRRKLLSDINDVVSTSFSPRSLFSSSSSSPLGRLSGCQNSQMTVDPVNEAPRYSSVRAAIFSCTDCGENFMKAESLELHQAVKHAVSELSNEDTSRNIVEIIFQSSWLRERTPDCRIHRILKIHNTPDKISRFEGYRDTIKHKASKLAKKHPRSTADGNELLRFHCTTFTCSLGFNGSTSLCTSIPYCNLCSIIRDGFKDDKMGRIRTMASSGRAHDAAQITSENGRIAMLVCRVIAGRVKKDHQDAMEQYDSAASAVTGGYSILDELYVFSPEAILPCFIVIYSS
ncbi:hypothetical protein Cni_G21065 [Canna indica]|uniref:C2H2-type domain-containing protein n=1 Tax=Canna indica TaxID=4628 RepID=A0AAQ3QIB6_9LILI|nr:hypothetical protein Cni_G21065 [Canna indica]